MDTNDKRDDQTGCGGTGEFIGGMPCPGCDACPKQDTGSQVHPESALPSMPQSVHDQIASLRADLDRAVRALSRAGFQDLGGQEWKPPIGPAPRFIDVPAPSDATGKADAAIAGGTLPCPFCGCVDEVYGAGNGLGTYCDNCGADGPSYERDGKPVATWNNRVPATSAADAKDAELTQAARDLLGERRRQVEVEGWTVEHDDAHNDGQLAVAAGYYALVCGYPHERDIGHGGRVPAYWPWAPSWWRPRDKRSNLVRAGALILAEIERIDRAAIAATQQQAQPTGKTLFGLPVVIDDSVPEGQAVFTSGRRKVVADIAPATDPVADTMDHAQLQALGNEQAWREQQQNHGHDMTKPCAREQFPNDGRGRTCERCAGSPVCTGQAWAGPFNTDGKK